MELHNESERPSAYRFRKELTDILLSQLANMTENDRKQTEEMNLVDFKGLTLKQERTMFYLLRLYTSAEFPRGRGVMKELNS